jgi:serine/threonine-protein kinase
MIALNTLIGKRYRVSSHIGNGGMQEVYLATDELMQIEIALKTPQPGQVDKSFKKSAVVSAKVNSHHVAKTLDYFVEDGRSFLIEEFINGEDLEKKLKKLGFLDPHLSAHVFHHLSKGILSSHDCGVIHRDLKPSNIMVAGGVNIQDLKITDFGIATLAKEVFDEAAAAGDLTQSHSGTVKGALPYMAPELMFPIVGENAGLAVDIWSLGAMMYQLMTGEYPFGVYLDAAVNVKANNRKIWPSFMTSNPQYAPLAKELQLLVESCLEYKAENRPTARELVSKCQQLRYLAVERSEATVDRLIQYGYSGIASNRDGDVFFSMQSVYGPNRPNIGTANKILISSFAGFPYRRAHPVCVLP